MFTPCIVVDHRRDDFPNDGGRNALRGYIENPIEKYFDLPLPEDKVMATYIWIDSTGENLRSKDKTLDVISKAATDKFALAAENANIKLTEETLKEIKCSQSEKHMPPYLYMPRNIENMYKVQCKFRSDNRNRSYFDENIKELPIVTFDGSATQQAMTTNSDLYLYPRAIYRNPFRNGNHILVMCDTYDMDLQPTETNHRFKCADAYRKCKENEPWFGVEQKFFLTNCSDSWPLGWPPNGFPRRKSHYYCGIGADRMIGRDLVDTHYRCCLFAGIPLNGICAEVGPSQWEYQVGPSVGVDAGDDLWISRYILILLAEQYGVTVTLDPKPVRNWEGSSAYTKFSTKEMRGENGVEEIEKAIRKLEGVHKEHLKIYDPHEGRDNERRFSDPYEKENIITEFSAGIAKKFCSIRIPLIVAKNKKGHLTDRRPASNCDPYQTITALMQTCLLND